MELGSLRAEQQLREPEMNSRHRCLGSTSVFALDRSRVGWDRIYTFGSHPPTRKAEKLPRSPEGWVKGAAGEPRKQLLELIRAQD